MTGLGVWVNAGASAVGALACGVFVVVYHVRATWWRSEVGRNQMSFAAVIGLLCLYTALATVWRADACVLMMLRVVSIGVRLAVVVLMVQRVRLLLKAQREVGRDG